MCSASPAPPPPPSPTTAAAAEGGGYVGADGVVLGGGVLQSPVATMRATPVARVSAASPVVSYLLSSHSPSSSSLTVCDRL
ncbi:unnamed protein product [Closterium sp. NIES-54]